MESEEKRDIVEVVLREQDELKIITEISFKTEDHKWDNVYAGDVVLYEDFGGYTYAAHVARIHLNRSRTEPGRMIYGVTLIRESGQEVDHKELAGLSKPSAVEASAAEPEL